jgi:hypothetical protein
VDVVGPGAARVIPTLFTGLCDDAALFPPGDTPVELAVPAHRGHRAGWYGDLVGPFLAAPKHFAEVAKAARETETLIPLILVVPDGPAALGAAVQATMGEPGVELVGVELACGPDGSAAQAANTAAYALARELLEGVRGVVEVRRGPDLEDALDVLASMSYRAKFRTGGTTSAAFPSVDELAGFIAGCTARGLPFKCTAGLHGAARHTDPVTGFEHHGFLNILAAADVAARGGNRAAIAETLRIRAGRELADAVRPLLADPEAAARTRRAFTGYGTCSIEEPLADLTALGLVSRPAPEPA